MQVLLQRVLGLLVGAGSLAACQPPAAREPAVEVRPHETIEQLVRFQDTLALVYQNPVVFTGAAGQGPGRQWGSFTVLGAAPAGGASGPPSPRDTLWSQVLLVSGRAASGERLQTLNLPETFGASRASQALLHEDILHLTVFYPHLYQVDSLYALRGQTIVFERGNTGSFQTSELAWDVKYDTFTELVDASFRCPPAADSPWQKAASAVGEPAQEYLAAYHSQAYWLKQAYAALARTHQVPPAATLARYLRLAYPPAAEQPALAPAYRPVLARLLRAYQQYPLPAALRKRVANACGRLDTLAPTQR